MNYHHEETDKLLNNNSNNNEEKYNNNSTYGFDLYQFRKIVSPIAMKFQNDNCNVRCIDWTSQRDDGGNNIGMYTTYRPYRWVRTITKSASYICRL